VWGEDFLLFFFPVHCLVCGKYQPRRGDILCPECEYGLPRTHYSGDPGNPVSRIFWGRVRVDMATSLFRFEKGSGYQVLLHELKYKGSRRVGRYLGRLLGNSLEGTSFSRCDGLVPVPLHPKRLRKRGYNQSELIARGVSEVTGIPLFTGVLQRPFHHESQTSLGRYERYENVRDDFRIAPDAPDLNGTSLLLVDDVVTTGATLEACSRVLLERYRCRVLVATACCA
jgi:ComF family protein